MANLIQTVVFGGTPSQELMLFLIQKDIPFLIYGTTYDICVGRNQIAEAFIKDGRYEHLVMINNDLVPTDSTINLWQSHTDLCFLDVCGSKGHNGCRSFNTAAAKYSRRMLQTLPKPLFKWDVSEDGCILKGCDCAVFKKMAENYGFESVKVGTAGHIVRAMVLPDGENTYKVELL